MLCTDPGKYNFTPRLFHFSAQSGVFKGEELLCASRATGVVTAMPFFQECLYSVPQPGKVDVQNVHLLIYIYKKEKKRVREKESKRE